jgi:hypothetical protein
MHIPHVGTPLAEDIGSSLLNFLTILSALEMAARTDNKCFT